MLSKSSNGILGNATNTTRLSDNNGDAKMGEMGNINKSGEHVVDIRTGGKLTVAKNSQKKLQIEIQ